MSSKNLSSKLQNFSTALNDLLSDLAQSSPPNVQAMMAEHVDDMVLVAGRGQLKVGFLGSDGALHELAVLSFHNGLQ